MYKYINIIYNLYIIILIPILYILYKYINILTKLI